MWCTHVPSTFSLDSVIIAMQHHGVVVQVGCHLIEPRSLAFTLVSVVHLLNNLFDRPQHLTLSTLRFGILVEKVSGGPLVPFHHELAHVLAVQVFCAFRRATVPYD